MLGIGNGGASRGWVDMQLASLRKYIPTELNLANQEDATAIIQMALNNRGNIILNIDGIALVGKLTIYSDTTLKINGTLKLKDNADDFMLENEHCVSETEYNKNIAIIGGTFDRNLENNNFTATVEFGYRRFVAFGLNLNNIENLRLCYNNFID